MKNPMLVAAAMAAIPTIGCGDGSKKPCPPWGNDPSCEFYNETDAVEQDPEFLPDDEPCRQIGEREGLMLVPFGEVDYDAWLYEGDGAPASMQHEAFPFAWIWSFGAAMVGNVAELFVVADPLTNTTELVVAELPTGASHLWIQTRGVRSATLDGATATLIDQTDGSEITYARNPEPSGEGLMWWWVEGPYGSQVRVRGHVTDGSAVEAGPAITNVGYASAGGLGFRPAAGRCVEKPVPPDPCVVISERRGIAMVPREAPYPGTFVGDVAGEFEDVYTMSWLVAVVSGWLWDAVLAPPVGSSAQLLPTATTGEVVASFPGSFEPGDVLWVHTGPVEPGFLTEGEAWLTDDVGWMPMDVHEVSDGSEVHFGIIHGGVGVPRVRTDRAIRGSVGAGSIKAGPQIGTTSSTQAFGAAFTPAWGVCTEVGAQPIDPCDMIGAVVGEDLEAVPSLVDQIDFGGPLRWSGNAIGVLEWGEDWVWADPGEPGDPAILDPGDGDLELTVDWPDEGVPEWAYVIAEGGGGTVEWRVGEEEEGLAAESIDFDKGIARVWLVPLNSTGPGRWAFLGGLDVRGVVTSGGWLESTVDGQVGVTEAQLGGVERGFMASYGYCGIADGPSPDGGPSTDGGDEGGVDSSTSG